MLPRSLANLIVFVTGFDDARGPSLRRQISPYPVPLPKSWKGGPNALDAG
jgi:hypothetical protein